MQKFANIYLINLEFQDIENIKTWLKHLYKNSQNKTYIFKFK